MYNMFTDYEKYFMDMINGKAKASTIHRMTFNKYYVGCTRATRNFILIEENKDLFDSENPIYKTFLSSFAPIYKEEQIGTYIMGQNTFDGWYYEALQSLDNDDMALFDQAISFASRLATTAEQKRKLQEIRGNDLNSLLELGNKFLKEGNYDLAKGVFKKCNALSNRKHEHYFALSLILNKQVIMHKRLIDELLNHREILDEYKEAIPLLLTQPLYIEMMKDLHTKLFKEKEK